MSVGVAEYLGQRTDGLWKIKPAVGSEHCPFMKEKCSKLKQKNKPVCSVRNSDGTLWITCRNRLCSTKKNVKLNKYQKDILLKIAKKVFPKNIDKGNILVRSETPIRHSSTSRKRSMADYIMRLDRIPSSQQSGPNKIILEMQGGGETSNTGNLTKHVDRWEKGNNHKASELAKIIKAVGTLETNAWRRQQEQFLVKGNIAIQSGGAMVFCVGTLLYDLLIDKVQGANMSDLKEHSWNLALIALCEDKSQPVKPGPVSITIDRLLFTQYHAFVLALTNQGEPSKELFTGKFNSLDGHEVIVTD